MLIEEFMQMFHEQSLILDIEIENTQTTLIFRSANQIPSCQRLFRCICIPSPKTLPEDPIQLLNDAKRYMQGAEEIDWHGS